MKRENVKIGVTAADRHNMLWNLLKTELFKDELNSAYDALYVNEEPANLVQAVFMAMLRRPLLICAYDDYELESSHFTTFFGVIGVRTHYTNPYVNDLYYLHEIAHAATMDYTGIDSIQEFHRRTGLNELFAATLTEVYVYDLYPDLREKTFDFPIWRDTYQDYNLPEKSRFKSTDLMMPCGFEDPVFLKWCTLRYGAIQHPDYLNLTEMQISAYAAQNAAWTQVWARSWPSVCFEMSSYLTCVQGHLSRVQDSINAHMAWLFHENMRPYDVTPFQREAEAFAVVLKDTKRRMGNIALFNKES